MQGTYTPWLVCLSIAVAIVVSYTALSLASRVANARGTAAIAWITGGAVVMGVGIWSMHFIGMLALSLPIRLTYSLPITVTSLGIAIAISAFALRVASDPTLDWRRLTVSAVLLGAGIASMHYTGMAGIRIVPALSYEPLPFAARHWLGAALLEAGRYADAQQTYTEELIDHPHNGWSLFGLLKAQDALGILDTDARTDYSSSWARSDTWIRASRF